MRRAATASLEELSAVEPAPRNRNPMAILICARTTAQEDTGPARPHVHTRYLVCTQYNGRRPWTQRGRVCAHNSRGKRRLERELAHVCECEPEHLQNGRMARLGARMPHSFAEEAQEHFLLRGMRSHAPEPQQLLWLTMQWAPYRERGTGDSLDALVQQRT